MSTKNTEAKRKWWSKFTNEERSKIMSERRKKFWSKKTKEQKMEVSKRLINARKLKKELTQN